MKATNEVKIYRCSICGNLSLMLEDSGVNPVCCGKPMELLEAKTTDDFHEKHVPVNTRDNCAVTVSVGSVVHPMIPEHYIKWILLLTTSGFHIAYLAPEMEPAACFTLCDGEIPLAAYACCNLHGLWKGIC